MVIVPSPQARHFTLASSRSSGNMADLDGQLRDYAFTLNGNAYAIDEAFKARDVPQYLTAKAPSSTSWTERSRSTDTASTRVINQEADQRPKSHQ
ncbi:hypothetical protein TCE0_018r05554 [Talaromyces pinophilus]|uniref:Uncharacterized protein n=1 Tax=Talaromyces pinophilus TaxID=128442 RepID=A0A510NW20_TALPI|nr:hypothetical protein TCE0_018r05554 [Talaromyces pinophilus]